MVHHRDGDKTNDSVDNLELLTNVEHSKEHHPVLPMRQLTCVTCGCVFERMGAAVNRMIAVSAEGLAHCSTSCAVKRFRLVRRHMPGRDAVTV